MAHAPLSPAAVTSSRRPDKEPDAAAGPVVALLGRVAAAASRAMSLNASTDVCAIVLAGPKNCRISAAARQAVRMTLPIVHAPPNGDGKRRTAAPLRGGTHMAKASAAERQQRSPDAALAMHAADRSPLP